jgi:cyanate permease
VTPRQNDQVEAILLQSLNAWLECMRFVSEVQSVISMRLMRLAHGGPQAMAEANWMLVEKVDAFADAGLISALAQGEGALIAAERAYTTVRRSVRANSHRLFSATRLPDGRLLESL